MSQFYKTSSSHCGKCNEFAAKIENRPKTYEVLVVCKNGHNIKIIIDKKTGNIETLTEENE